MRTCGGFASPFSWRLIGRAHRTIPTPSGAFLREVGDMVGDEMPEHWPKYLIINRNS